MLHNAAYLVINPAHLRQVRVHGPGGSVVMGSSSRLPSPACVILQDMLHVPQPSGTDILYQRRSAKFFSISWGMRRSSGSIIDSALSVLHIHLP